RISIQHPPCFCATSTQLILHAAERRLLPVNHDPWVLLVGYSRQALRFDKIELLLLGAKRRFPNGCGRLALCAWKEKSWRAGGQCCCAQGLARAALSPATSTMLW